MSGEDACCPRCFSPLDGPSAIERASVWSCKTCSGVFVDAISSGAHAELVERAHLLDASAARKVAGSRPAGPCPICRKFMALTTIRAADATIDVCIEHGAWYDKGELERVVRILALQAAARASTSQTGAKANGTPSSIEPLLAETGSYRRAPGGPERAEASKPSGLPLLRNADRSSYSDVADSVALVTDLLELISMLASD